VGRARGRAGGQQEAAPRPLCGGLFFVSGEIPRVTPHERGLPNRGLPNQVARSGEDEPWEPNAPVTDDRFLAVRLRDKGVVVFTACSLAGVVSVLAHARELFPGARLHAVVGGLHLSGENEAAIPETVRDLGRFGLDLIIPAHCTGWRGVNALERAFGDAVVVPAAVGKTFAL
jgi:7,8-dihydropterin-6-yl-methyl-4-(beta-D-ribofuranosyl)aminobenzene 5'-phosphate synthase